MNEILLNPFPYVGEGLIHTLPPAAAAENARKFDKPTVRYLFEHLFAEKMVHCHLLCAATFSRGQARHYGSKKPCCFIIKALYRGLY